MEEFLQALASKTPVPGGGGASAVGGAIGAALGEMVANLTVGKKKYAESEPLMKECLEKLEQSRERFLFLAKEDERVFEPLSKAYGIKSATDEEKRERDLYMEKCLLDAALVPLDIMRECLTAMDSLQVMAEKGSRLAVSDAGVGVQFLRAALLGAVMNVYINTKTMKNRDQAEQLNQTADELILAGTEKADAVYQTVLEAVRP